MKNKIIIFLLSLILTMVFACQRQNSNWNLLLNDENVELAYDANNAKLWIINESKNSLGYIEVSQKADNTKVDISYPLLISPNSILDFCASGDIWIVTDNGILFFYETLNQSWVEVSSINTRVRSCELLASRTIAIIADDNKVGIVNQKDINWLPNIKNKTIRNLSQDDNGSIWAVSFDPTENEDIVYKLEAQNGWSEKFRGQGGRLLLVKNNSIWTAGNPMVSIIKTTLDNTDTPIASSRQIQIDGLLLDFFVDKNQNIWVITDSGILLKAPNDKNFNATPLPNSVKRIIDSEMDQNSCIIYISTNQGVFYSADNCQTQ